MLDGCLCLPCCLFSTNSNGAQNFVLRPFRNWTTFNEKVRVHYTSSTHSVNALAMKSFLEAQSGTQPMIDTSINKQRAERHQLNFKHFDAIIDCVVLCGRQNSI